MAWVVVMDPPAYNRGAAPEGHAGASQGLLRPVSMGGPAPERPAHTT